MKRKYMILMLLLFSLLVITPSVHSGAAILEADKEATEGVDDLNEILYTIIEGAGDVLLVLGVWKFGIGITSDQAHELSKGTSFLVAGAVLANLQSIMDTF